MDREPGTRDTLLGVGLPITGPSGRGGLPGRAPLALDALSANLTTSALLGGTWASTGAVSDSVTAECCCLVAPGKP